jgi:hypothetical protein
MCFCERRIADDEAGSSKAKDDGKQKLKRGGSKGAAKPKPKQREVGIRTNAPTGPALKHRHTVIVPTTSYHLLFHKDRKGTQASLTEGRRVFTASGGYCASVLEAPCVSIPAPKHIVELRVLLTGGHGSAIGMMDESAEVSNAPGHIPLSVGLCGDGKLYRDGKHTGQANAGTYKEGDRIKMVYDVLERQLRWQVNGQVVATAMEVPPGWHFGVGRYGSGKFSCKLTTSPTAAGEPDSDELETGDLGVVVGGAENEADREARLEEEAKEQERSAALMKEEEERAAARRVVNSKEEKLRLGLKVLINHRLIVGFAMWRSAYKLERAKEKAAREAAERSRTAATMRARDVQTSGQRCAAHPPARGFDPTMRTALTTTPS